MSNALIAALACVAFVGSAVGYSLYKLFQYRRQFESLPGIPTSQVVTGGRVSALQVATALDIAAQALVKFGPWKAAQVIEMAHHVTIVVMATNAWTDSYGRHVAGTQQVGGANDVWLQVGLDLAAMCHELAHACELRLDGATDDQHVHWNERGLFRAVDVYASAYPAK